MKPKQVKQILLSEIKKFQIEQMNSVLILVSASLENANYHLRQLYEGIIGMERLIFSKRLWNRVYFLNETNMFVKWILKYYGLNDTENLTITSMVEDLNNTYAGKVLVSTDAIHEELRAISCGKRNREKRKYMRHCVFRRC